MSKDNVLIAEFMNLESELLAKGLFQRKYKHSFSSHGFSDWVSEEMLEFHSSWDWLMPVVEKIESLGYKWEIGMSATSPYHYCKIWSIGTVEGISPLDAIYGAIIEFIKWYNNK